jgi:outer membrane protein assembly factor BamB
MFAHAGKTKWRWVPRLSPRVQSTTPAASANVQLVTDGVVVATVGDPLAVDCGGSSGAIVALRTSDQSILWLQEGPWATAATVLDKGTVYALSACGRLAALSLETGKIAWNQSIEASSASGSLAPGLALIVRCPLFQCYST